MMTKEELKTIYAEYKRGIDDGTFSSVLYDNLKGALKDIGFEISLKCGSIFSGKKKKKFLYNYITITITRGKEQYFTQRVNALIDFAFSERRDKNDLFNIIYNRA